MSGEPWYDDPGEGPWWVCRAWRRERYRGVKLGPFVVACFRQWGSASWQWMLRCGDREWESGL